MCVGARCGLCYGGAVPYSERWGAHGGACAHRRARCGRAHLPPGQPASAYRALLIPSSQSTPAKVPQSTNPAPSTLLYTRYPPYAEYPHTRLAEFLGQLVLRARRLRRCAARAPLWPRRLAGPPVPGQCRASAGPTHCHIHARTHARTNTRAHGHHSTQSGPRYSRARIWRARRVLRARLAPRQPSPQEAHGASVGSQPFFVEGVREALDVAAEWCACACARVRACVRLHACVPCVPQVVRRASACALRAAECDDRQ